MENSPNVYSNLGLVAGNYYYVVDNRVVISPFESAIEAADAWNEIFNELPCDMHLKYYDSKSKLIETAIGFPSNHQNR